MTTPDPTSKQRRLRIVGDKTAPERVAGEGNGKDRTTAAVDGVTPEQAAAFAAVVAEADQVTISHTLEQMGTEQLRSLAIILANQVNAAETASGEIANVGPEGACTIAVAAAAQGFGTTRAAVLSADRHRAVTDARAVAMTAARRAGMTMTSIAAYFGKDHTSVVYAQSKVATNPRLNAACARIVGQLEDHYTHPTTTTAQVAGSSAETGRSRVLQFGALEESGRSAAAQARDEDRARPLSPAAPGR